MLVLSFLLVLALQTLASHAVQLKDPHDSLLVPNDEVLGLECFGKPIKKHQRVLMEAPTTETVYSIPRTHRGLAANQMEAHYAPFSSRQLAPHKIRNDYSPLLAILSLFGFPSLTLLLLALLVLLQLITATLSGKRSSVVLQPLPLQATSGNLINRIILSSTMPFILWPNTSSIAPNPTAAGTSRTTFSTSMHFARSIRGSRSPWTSQKNIWFPYQPSSLLLGRSQ